MKYCANCESEYQDNVTTCADCGGKELISAEEMRKRGKVLPGDTDTRRFVRAGTAEDPLSAEQFTRSLQAAGISVFARARRESAVDALTSGSTMPWWELLVPEESLDAARRLIDDERAKVEANAAEAGRAADEEEAEGEKK